jgi:acyl carrier protein
VSEQTVENTIIQLTNDLIEDWGLDDVEIARETTFRGDLGFDSSDIMQIFTAIHEHYRGVDFRFQELVMKDNKFVEDLSIGQIAIFVLKKLGTQA